MAEKDSAGVGVVLAEAPGDFFAPVQLDASWMASLTEEQRTQMQKEVADLTKRANNEYKYAVKGENKHTGEKQLAFFKKEYEEKQAKLMKKYQRISERDSTGVGVVLAEAPVASPSVAIGISAVLGALAAAVVFALRAFNLVAFRKELVDPLVADPSIE